MTCIVGLETEQGVYIGGDSAGLSGWSKTIRADQKVFEVGTYIMGFTTSFRMGQLLRYRFDIPAPTVDEVDDLDRFVATKFIDAIRTTLKDGGWATVKEGQEEGGTFLAGIAGRLYRFDSDYQFGRSTNGYSAVGCGGDIALGSLHSTGQYDIHPRTRVELALEAAADLSGGVAAPFTVIEGRRN